MLEQLRSALADRYRIERELGAGGMATVFLAQDLKHDRKVALKVLKPELAAVLGAERFVIEIKTTASLSHPHILPLFDSGSAGGFLFYVMPYVEGETLRQKLDRERQFGIDEAVRITRDVGDALDYAHRHGVIHRDIKPENILLHDGRPMVADFGIALALSAAAGGRMTETGLSLGTPHYMSPEQATAEKEITARSDVYSLASVLYEMLTGNPPHTGATAQQIIMKIIAEPVEAVTKFRKSVPANVAAALAMALEKLPADRFESAKAFIEALANPAFTSLGAADVAGGVLSTRGGVAPRAFWTTVGVAAIALVLAAVGWFKPAPVAEVSRFSLLLPDSQALATIANFRVAISPDGRTIVYVGAGATSAQTRLWVRHMDELRATPLAGTEGAINPAISPDNTHVAFVVVGSPRSLRTMPLAGGPALIVTNVLVDLGGVSWGSDGYIYYDGHLEGDGIARVRETGGQPPEIVTRPDTASAEQFHFTPFALPNGRGVLFSIRTDGEWKIGVVDLRTGKHRALLSGAVPRYSDSGHLIFVLDGTLMAAPFDATRLELTGEAVPVASGIAVHENARSDIGISRDGLLVYAGGSNSTGLRELVWVDRAGSVTPALQWSALIAWRARLSPDGKAVAVAVGPDRDSRQVWVLRLDRGTVSKLADGGNTPIWSPDGEKILFASKDFTAGALGPADGSVLPTEFSNGTRQFIAPEFSPDGTWIAFSSQFDLYARRTDGDTAVRELLRGPAFEGRPSISPDGRWLLYQSDESGRAESYVRPFPDTKSAKHQLSIGGGISPRWSRSGREIFFVNEQQELIAVPVTLSPTFVAGRPRTLFSVEPFSSQNNWPFDVDVDGHRFLFSRPVAGGRERPDELIVVQNFFEELKAKVKR